MSFTTAQAKVPTASLGRNRDFVLAVSARTVSLLGDYAALVALTLRTAGHGPWAVTALLVAGFLPIVAMTPIAGLLADRYDSRTLLVSASLAQLVLCLALARASTGPLVLVLVFGLGCGDAIVGATWAALLPGIVGRERLGAATGIRQAAATAAGIVAPALGGLLTGAGGAALVLNLDAVSFLAIAGAALGVRHRRGNRRSTGTDAWRAGFRVINGDPVLKGLLAALFAFCLVAGMANVVTVFLIRQTLHASTTWYGIEGAVCAAAMTAGALLAGRIRGQRQLVSCGLAGMGGLAVACIGYSVAPSVVWLLVPATLCGLANAALNVSVSAVTMLRAPDAARGRVSAAINGATSSAMIGSMLLGGLLAAVLTPREVFACAGLATLAIPAALTRRLLRAVAAPEATPLPRRDTTNRPAADKLHRRHLASRWSTRAGVTPVRRGTRQSYGSHEAIGSGLPYQPQARFGRGTATPMTNRPPTVAEFHLRAGC